MDMQVGAENPSEVTENPTTPAAPETPAPAPAAPEPQAEPAPLAADAPVPAAYTPNLKFKVMDKEHEFHPFLKDAIKDADTEKQIREIYEKAYGLDHVKPKYQEARKEALSYKQEVEEIKGGITELRETYQRGDLDSFFSKLNIPEEKVLQWAVQKVEYMQLPPEQRQVLDKQRNAEQRAIELEKRLQTQDRDYSERISETKIYALQLSLDRADVKSFADQFDSQVGKPGSFRDAVIQVGEAAFTTKGIDLTPEQAVNEVMQHYGKFFRPGQSTGTPPAPQAAAPGQPPTPAAPRKEPPVIPNVGGRSASPMKQKPKSLEDIKKLASQMS